MEDQATGGPCLVDVFRQGPEVRAACLDDLNNVEQVAQGARQVVVFAADNHILVSEVVKQTIELRTLAKRAGQSAMYYECHLAPWCGLTPRGLMPLDGASRIMASIAIRTRCGWNVIVSTSVSPL